MLLPKPCWTELSRRRKARRSDGDFPGIAKPDRLAPAYENSSQKPPDSIGDRRQFRCLFSN
jgi:hypothetical protein